MCVYIGKFVPYSQSIWGVCCILQPPEGRQNLTMFDQFLRALPEESHPPLKWFKLQQVWSHLVKPPWTGEVTHQQGHSFFGPPGTLKWQCPLHKLVEDNVVFFILVFPVLRFFASIMDSFPGVLLSPRAEPSSPTACAKRWTPLSGVPTDAKNQTLPHFTVSIKSAQ